MAKFRSLNPLGTFYSPADGVAVIKVDVPGNALGYDGELHEVTFNEGGALNCRTADLNTAINRNWRNCAGGCPLGLEIEWELTPVVGPGADFVQSVSASSTEFGEIGPVEHVEGEDMTMGNPQHGRETIFKELEIGTATQLNETTFLAEAGVPVYIEFELDWCFYAYRFWSKGPVEHNLAVPFALLLTARFKNETGYSWLEAGEPAGQMRATTNWLDVSIAEMADWNLPTDFPGLNPADGWTVIGEADARFEFGDEAFFPGAKLRSYKDTEVGERSECLFTNCRVILPTIADALPEL